MMGLWNRDMWTGAAVILLALLSIFFVIPIGVVVPGNVEVRVMAPDFWPLTISMAAAIAGGFVFLGGLLDQKNQRLSATPAALDEGVSAEARDSKHRSAGTAAARVVAVIGSLFILYLVIPMIGIVAGTMALLVFLIRFTGEARWKYIVSIAIVLPSILYIFFVYVASVPLPLGFFEQFR